MRLKYRIIGIFTKLASRSMMITKIARRVVAWHDNDANSDMLTNGEQNLLRYLSTSDLFTSPTNLEINFFDVGANKGLYTKLLHDYFFSRQPIPRGGGGGFIRSFPGQYKIDRSLKPY